MAERIVETVIQQNGLSAKPCMTGETPLPGGESKAIATESLKALDGETSERLMRLYGTEADVLATNGGTVAAEVNRAVLVEGAIRLEDYWVRRSGRAWFDHNAGLDSLKPAATEMAKLLGWGTKRQKSEIENCQNIDRQSKTAFNTKGT